MSRAVACENGAGSERRIVQHFRVDATESDHHHGPIVALVRDPRNQLASGRRHLLHENAANLGLTAIRPGIRDDFIERRANAFVIGSASLTPFASVLWEISGD